MSDLPKRVTIEEEGPREGVQSEPAGISVADKARLVESLAEAGLSRIACTSYVNPARVPQMADAEAVAAAIRRRPGVVYSALWLNRRGLERALAGPLDVLGSLRVTASETFSRRNVGMSVDEALAEQRTWFDLYRRAGTTVDCGIVLGAFGCNYEGEIPPAAVLGRVATLMDEADAAGFRLSVVKLTDAMGWANPRAVERLVGAVRERWPELEISLHLHDTRGMGMACAYAGLHMGVTKFDASIGGLGGCPFAASKGAAGNICTEDFAFLCAEAGIETGLDLDALIESALLAERIVGHPLPGKVMKGGTLDAARRRAAA